MSTTPTLGRGDDGRHGGEDADVRDNDVGDLPEPPLEEARPIAVEIWSEWMLPFAPGKHSFPDERDAAAGDAADAAADGEREVRF